MLQRRHFLCVPAAAVLSGCGFQLRAEPHFVFQTIAVTPEHSGAVATSLARYLGDRVRPVAGVDGVPPDVILDILQETRKKEVLSLNSSGLVTEYQLFLTVRFRLRNAKGRDLIEPTDILQQRDMSYSASAALAKEAEEGLQYRDMQSNVVQQLMRRLAAVQSID